MYRRLLPVSLLWLAWGCGGSDKPAESPASSEASDGERAERAEREETADGAESQPAAARKAACDDGTCTTCGSALCPSGWYCDESAAGGPACGWLPECVKKPGCACVKRAFAGCACEDQHGAAHVSCS